MSIEKLTAALDGVSYAPRSLALQLPADLTQQLSPFARGFLEVAFGKSALSFMELTSVAWKDDELARSYFLAATPDTRTEILAFLTTFIHEYTHRVDFLISPFGLHYYVNTLREYWYLQHMIPPLVDDPKTLDSLRFIVGLRENSGTLVGVDAAQWENLERIVHLSYAWGDASAVKPLGKYIKAGWDGVQFESDSVFGMPMPLEPVTVLGLLHTFRVPGGDQFWYLRPLTLFETKAMVNSLLFILHLLGDQGPAECARYYERLYVRRRAELPGDYFFLLDLGASMYRHDDFASLLRAGNLQMIRSTLIILSSVCWYALQAPPPLTDEDSRVANPILRLLTAFRFFVGYARGQIRAQFNTTAEALLLLDSSRFAEQLFVKPISRVIPDCVKILDKVMELNERQTWNPQVKRHFQHIFSIMRPHFADREANYVSLLGMPDNGSLAEGCLRNEDWEITYDDYRIPAEVKQWFDIRTDLFFNLLKPPAEMMEQLDAHYLAFYIPHVCKCGLGVSGQWASRFASVYTLNCGFCGEQTVLRRDEFTSIHVTPDG
jgi:hypothetical protein